MVITKESIGQQDPIKDRKSEIVALIQQLNVQINDATEHIDELMDELNELEHNGSV